MSLPYNLTLTEQGSYLFKTNADISYSAFFTSCNIDDKEGNTHHAFSFGFERCGKYSSEKFANKYDQRIKCTIIFIIKEFFRLHGNDALIYFCFQDDEYARHRSIVFNRWYVEEFAYDVEHYKKTVIIKENMLYGGMLILRDNPLGELLIEAVNAFFDEIMEEK